MIRSFLMAATSVLVLAACTSTDTPAPVSDPVETVEKTEAVSQFELAMGTVSDLTATKNTQAAIGRLTQLVGDPSLSREEMAEVLFELGNLSMSETGYDSVGAVSYYDEIVNDYADTDWATVAAPKLDEARGKVTSLMAISESVESTRQQKFDALMQLGKHQAAMDIMQSANLTPNNSTLLAMYQIGYLCEGTDLTGRAYEATDNDGTARSLRFCDLGK